ncbi:uncharacterized protein [Rhodnius prolixus]|uniref:uncharacterized protein n=1 Tax=Rhodnius prolixus TaxID=13249 RepID=UPI003D18F0FF
MRLSKSADPEKGIRSSLCLDGEDQLTNQMCTATGWGRITKTVLLSSTLRQVKIPVHRNQLCKNVYGPSIPTHEGHICAGKLDGSTGACISFWSDSDFYSSSKMNHQVCDEKMDIHLYSSCLASLFQRYCNDNGKENLLLETVRSKRGRRHYFQEKLK